MALMRPISELRDQMERVFHEMEEFQLPHLTEWHPFGFRERSMRPWLPAVDIFESNGNYEVKMEVPGIKPEDLDVEIREDSVVVFGQTKQEQLEEKKDIYRRECHYGTLYRKIPLPGIVKTEGAKAELKNGILDLTLPKAKEEKGKRLQIQSK